MYRFVVGFDKLDQIVGHRSAGRGRSGPTSSRRRQRRLRLADLHHIIDDANGADAFPPNDTKKIDRSN